MTSADVTVLIEWRQRRQDAAVAELRELLKGDQDRSAAEELGVMLGGLEVISSKIEEVVLRLRRSMPHVSRERWR